MKLGVAVSGKGSNLRNLVDLGFDVVAVATNRPSCGGAAFARQRRIPVGELSLKRFASEEARDAAMRDFFRSHDVELVVDAGYDRIHTRPFLEGYRGRIINVHPSLLPEFGGSMDAVEQALRSGVPVTGATVHLVTEDLDAGPILARGGGGQGQRHGGESSPPRPRSGAQDSSPGNPDAGGETCREPCCRSVTRAG